MAKIESNYDGEQLINSIGTLQKAHSFLRSLIGEETDTGRIYYQERVEIQRLICYTNSINKSKGSRFYHDRCDFDMTLPEGRKVQAKLAVKDEYTFDLLLSGKPVRTL